MPPVKKGRKPHRHRARGKVGPPGPKGDPGAWPSAAYDALEEQIMALRNDLEDLRATVAALQENAAQNQFRFKPSSGASSGRGRDQSES